MLGGWAAAQLVLWTFEIPDVRLGLQLDAAGVHAGEYWRFFTHQLFHVNALHFLANVLVFYFAGREVEPIIGRGPFVALCITAGLLGGAVNWFALHGGAVLGFSAVTAAVLAAYATILPELEQRILLFFVLPVRFRVKWIALPVAAAAAVALAMGDFGEVGPAGILAGSVLGWICARSLGFGRQSWLQRRKAERRERDVRLARMDSGEFIASEVDPVLEKIAREGMGSLTRAERKLLDLGREKLVSSHPENR